MRGGFNRYEPQTCDLCGQEFQCQYIERYCADCDAWGE